ncbi:hypothetical protein B0J12DRAFT_656436 [Macrophomina phaseolina]|uniref:Uncharacterized protein n=1 Tax=Macrophomina phaseolina TaxID=35725 RepID=A0ABQ8GKQ1_9PEZI|nr:hypothetical protein B0J12DRAFT_656436 [Macrophomina phaseolina]
MHVIDPTEVALVFASGGSPRSCTDALPHLRMSRPGDAALVHLDARSSDVFASHGGSKNRLVTGGVSSLDHWLRKRSGPEHRLCACVSSRKEKPSEPPQAEARKVQQKHTQQIRSLVSQPFHPLPAACIANITSASISVADKPSVSRQTSSHHKGNFGRSPHATLTRMKRKKPDESEVPQRRKEMERRAPRINPRRRISPRGSESRKCGSGGPVSSSRQDSDLLARSCVHGPVFSPVLFRTSIDVSMTRVLAQNDRKMREQSNEEDAVCAA